MDSRASRLRATTPGKGEGKAESYKERAIRYCAEVHSLRGAVGRLEGEISLLETPNSTSEVTCELVDGRSAVEWATHANELELGMRTLV